MSTIRKTPSHRVSRNMPIVRRFNRFFAARPRRSASPVRRWSNRLSRSTERGISKGGEPSKPTPSRILPSIGTITLIASRQLSAVLAAEIRPGLHDRRQPKSDPAQEMNDVGAVAEEDGEHLLPAQPRDNPMHPV